MQTYLGRLSQVLWNHKQVEFKNKGRKTIMSDNTDKAENPFGDILSQYSSNFSSSKSSSSGFDFGDFLNSITKGSKPNDDEFSKQNN